ncbi:MAG TPA: hypothetical protein VL382_07025 [Terriglobales bacterium]|nr:hypothetical protein [Terriglobales bacterium]
MKVAKIVPLAVLALVAAMAAQAPAPVAAPSINQLNALLAQLDQTAQTTNLDLAKLRIEKWKGDGDTKRTWQSNADLLSRNLTGTLPGLLATVRTSPDNLEANFKLYRNVDALFDVLSTLADTAGRSGNSNDYQTLATDSGNLQNIRHALADRIEALATFKDAQLARMASGPAPAAKSGTGPRKIVIDDTPTTHKTTTRKKKPATGASTPQ